MSTSTSKMYGLVAIAALVTLVGAVAPAYAGTNGVAEAGVGVALPVADGGYRKDYAASPTVWLAGVYLPRYASRVFGVELGFEWTPFNNDGYKAPNAAATQTDFTRFRLQVGGRYFRPLAPKLTGFARALAGVDIFSWTQTGRVGAVAFEATDADLGVALELGAGVMYQISSFTVGAQAAVPIGLHNQKVYDANVEINHNAFDFELRLTIGTSY